MFAIILGFAINKHNPFYSFALGAVSVSTGIKWQETHTPRETEKRRTVGDAVYYQANKLESNSKG